MMDKAQETLTELVMHALTMVVKGNHSQQKLICIYLPRYITHVLLQTPYYQNQDELDSFLVAVIHGNMASLRCMIEHAVSGPQANHWTRGLRSLWEEKADDVRVICDCLELSKLVDKRNQHGRTLLRLAPKLAIAL